MKFVRVIEYTKDKATVNIYKLEDETYDEYVESEVEEYRDDPCDVRIVEFALLDENKDVIKDSMRTIVL